MSRRGSSLIELLVVIGIIGVVLLLFLPALAGGNEAARRIQCMNNLRQISLSLLNYHHEFGVFPPGYTDGPSPRGAAPGSVWGWFPSMLAHIEQNSLAREINPFRPVDSPENRTARISSIRTMICGPKSEGDRDLLKFPSGPKGQPPVEMASACYVASFGTRDPLDPKWKGQGDGVFFRNSAIGLHQVVDGVSTTFLVGERDRRLAPSAWMGGIGPQGVAMVVGSTGDDPGPNGKPRRPWQFSSPHEGGAFFAFADGGVRFVTDTASPPIYRALATRNGEEAVPDPMD